jgi:hypothetical protein
MRLGCRGVRRDVIHAVDGGALRPRNQVSVRIDRQVDRRVPELILDVDDRLPLLRQ